MTEQNLFISGRSLTGSRFAKSKKNYINSYAFIQANASMSKRHTVSTDLALIIEKADCYCYISVTNTDSESLRESLYKEILKKEAHYSSYKSLDSEALALNMLKWVFLNWNNPVINLPVKKTFPDVREEFQMFVDGRITAYQKIKAGKQVKQQKESEELISKFIIGQSYSVPYGTSQYQATFQGLSKVYKGQQMGKFVFLLNGVEKEIHVVLGRVQ